MSTLLQHIAKLRSLQRDLPGLKQSLGQDYGDTATALAKERGIETGIDADGIAGNKVKYSEKKVPSYLLRGKELNQAGRNYLDKNKTANWYGLRQAQGLRSENVNLTYTGLSWKGFGTKSITLNGGKISISIGVSGEHAGVFMNNVKRYGKFYLNTPAEIQTLQQNNRDTIHRWLTDYRI